MLIKPNYELVIDLTFETYGILGVLYTIGAIVPAFAVTVRRLYDTEHSSWTFLLGLIPVIGGVILLIFLVQDSQPEENQYGVWPKEGIEVKRK